VKVDLAVFGESKIVDGPNLGAWKVSNERLLLLGLQPVQLFEVISIQVYDPLVEAIADHLNILEHVNGFHLYFLTPIEINLLP
jgi:hypothetical protein